PSTPRLPALSLHDALPIFGLVGEAQRFALQHPQPRRGRRDMGLEIGAALAALGVQSPLRQGLEASGQVRRVFGQLGQGARIGLGDRKSTRLNSSHVEISYA